MWRWGRWMPPTPHWGSCADRPRPRSQPGPGPRAVGSEPDVEKELVADLRELQRVGRLVVLDDVLLHAFVPGPPEDVGEVDVAFAGVDHRAVELAVLDVELQDAAGGAVDLLHRVRAAVHHPEKVVLQ